MAYNTNRERADFSETPNSSFRSDIPLSQFIAYIFVVVIAVALIWVATRDQQRYSALRAQVTQLSEQATATEKQVQGDISSMREIIKRQDAEIATLKTSLANLHRNTHPTGPTQRK